MGTLNNGLKSAPCGKAGRNLRDVNFKWKLMRLVERMVRIWDV